MESIAARNSVLQSLLMEDQIGPFKAWESEQRKERFAASFDSSNTPSISQLVDVAKKISFYDDSTFEEFYKVAFRYPNTPRIPLIKTQSYDYSVQLGGSIGSPMLANLMRQVMTHEETLDSPVSDYDSDLSSEAARTKETWERHVESDHNDSFLDPGPPHKFVEAFRRDWTKTFESNLSQPLRSGFSLGKIVMESSSGKSSTAEDTGYFLVLDSSRKSLWMVHNYYPQNDQGDPVIFQPVESSNLVRLLDLPKEQLFDCAKLFDSVEVWDHAKPLSALPIAESQPTMYSLVAEPVAPARLYDLMGGQDVFHLPD